LALSLVATLFVIRFVPVAASNKRHTLRAVVEAASFPVTHAIHRVSTARRRRRSRRRRRRHVLPITVTVSAVVDAVVRLIAAAREGVVTTRTVADVASVTVAGAADGQARVAVEEGHTDDDGGDDDSSGGRRK